MNKKELKDRINEIAKEYNVDLSVTEDVRNIYIKIKITTIAYANKTLPCFMNADIAGMYYFNEEARQKILEALYEYSKTPFKERQEERYIIPLPHLVTTDGEQQYLTHNGSFFASRRDKKLRQTWKKEHLKYIPEEYRKYAVEMEEEE